MPPLPLPDLLLLLAALMAAGLVGGLIAGLFGVMRPYMPSPPSPAPPSPFEWGRPERVSELLCGDFDLKFETGTTVLRMQSGERVWEVFSTGYGPTKMLHQTIDRKTRPLLVGDDADLDRRARFQPVALDHFRDADRGDDDVGAADV